MEDAGDDWRTTMLMFCLLLWLLQEQDRPLDSTQRAQDRARFFEGPEDRRWFRQQVDQDVGI